MAEAIGSSTGVLRFLFGSKDGLVRAILERGRRDELEFLGQLGDVTDAGLKSVAERVWIWLSEPHHRPVVVLWTESYAASLLAPDGPWADFARTTVTDWLTVLARAQPAERRHTPAGRAERTAVLAVLRGAMLDLLATGDRTRTAAAVAACVEGVLPAVSRASGGGHASC